MDLALIPFPRPPVHPIIEGVPNLPGIGLIESRGMLGPVAVNIGAFMDMLPHLFLCRRIFDALDNLPRIWAYNGAYTPPATPSVAYMGKN